MAHPTSAAPEKEESSQSEEEAPSPDSTTKENIPSVTSLGMKEKTPMCLVNELARFNKVCCYPIFIYYLIRPLAWRWPYSQTSGMVSSVVEMKDSVQPQWFFTI